MNNMEIVKLINEYKKIDIENMDFFDRKKLSIYTSITGFIFSFIIVSFFIPIDPILKLGLIFLVIFTILSNDIEQKIYRSYTKKYNRALYIKSILNNEIYTGSLSHISDRSLLVEDSKGEELKQEIILNNGLKCSTILRLIHKFKKINTMIKEEKEQNELEELMIREKTPTGKILDFINNLEGNKTND